MYIVNEHGKKLIYSVFNELVIYACLNGCYFWLLLFIDLREQESNCCVCDMSCDPKNGWFNFYINFKAITC